MFCGIGVSAARKFGSLALYSADYTQITGQALVTRRVAEMVMPRLGGEVEYIYRPGGGGFALLSWLAAVARLWRDVARGRVKTLYLVCSRSNAGFIRDVPALLMALAGTRVVVHAHGSDIVTLLRSQLVSPLARALYRNCEVIVPSYHILAGLAPVRLACVHVCENYSLGSRLEANPTAFDRGRLKVLWNSNVMASKGAFDLMAASRRPVDHGAIIELAMIGAVLADEEMAQNEAAGQFEARRSAGGVAYHGRVSATRAAELVAQSDVIALPSRYSSECQPMAVIEGMCAGRGIVVSDTPALRATLGEYPAEFVPVRDVEALAKALRRLHEEKQADPAAFFARRAGPAAAARERFSSSRFDRELRQILLRQKT